MCKSGSLKGVGANRAVRVSLSSLPRKKENPARQIRAALMRAAMKKRTSLFRSNMRCAQAIWGELPVSARRSLEKLSRTYVLSVAVGDLQFLNGRWYVTHAGLLRISQRRRCYGIRTTVQKDLCDPVTNRWVFRATVYKSPGSKGFVGYGDADPSNTSTLVRGAEMRVAETRAVNRALRKAYGIGLCSVEEVGAHSFSAE